MVDDFFGNDHDIFSLSLFSFLLLPPPPHATPPPLLPHPLQEPESLASSVADGVQQLLMNLRLSDVMVSRPVPPSETGGQVETNNIGVSKV